jgi:DNA-3-methyladenine glycosylase
VPRSRTDRPIPRSFYDRDARAVAPELLHKVLVHGERRGRIVEVEAYVGDGTDAGSHAHRGRTKRNATMFGPPGHLYVYFTYGMHWCCNAVCDPEGTASAVLLRAVEPLTGLHAMREARPAARRDTDLGNGPAKLCQAFGIVGAHDGVDLVRPPSGGITIVDDGTPPPDAPVVATRIGLSAGADLPWRWYVDGNANVSRTLRGPVTVTRPSRKAGEQHR